MKHLYNFFCIIAIASLSSSCSWFEDSQNSTYDDILSASIKSPDAKFSNYMTFAITDKVLFAYDEESKRESNPIGSSIINNVTKNMLDLGYTQIYDNSMKADLLVDISVLVSTHTTYYPGSYLWWDWNYWDPYWGYDPFYPYYPYPLPTYSSSYTSGTIIIDVLSAKELKEKENKVPVIWHGYVRSILDVKHTESQRNAAIDKCFTMLPPK